MRPGYLIALLLTTAVVRLAAAAPPADVRKPAAPGRCSIRQNAAGWQFVSPEGRGFFSLGVCVVTQGTARGAYDPENPSYAAWQYYGTSPEWADASLRRLKSWGITTLGGWSDFDTLRPSTEETLWLTPVLHIGSTAGAPWWDMWDENNVRRMEDVARSRIGPLADDPRVIGYYSDNELGWWNAPLWKMTLEQPQTSGQRRRLLRLLRETYGGDWQRLRADFEPEQAENWTQLEARGGLRLKQGGNGVRVMRRFLGVVAARYYELMRDIIRKFDPHALFLGDRYQSFYYPQVARAAAPFVDAVSTNLNAAWSDGTFPRFQLDTLHALTGKPVLVSEFYAAAADNRSGNKNTHGAFPVVATQPERAQTARTTLEAVARLPYVLGADWFQFADEPRHGRADGENFNFGLVDIHDEPYAELAAALSAFRPAEVRARGGGTRSDASSGVPPAPGDALGDFTARAALLHWDRERGFVKPASEHPLADLYVCWSSKALYLGILAHDVVESGYYSDGPIPKEDRALWTVEVNGGRGCDAGGPAIVFAGGAVAIAGGPAVVFAGGPAVVRARIGAGLEPLVSDDRVRVENASGHDLQVRNFAAMELPAALLGKDGLKAGDQIELSSVLLSHFQVERTEWRGRFTLAGPPATP